MLSNDSFAATIKYYLDLYKYYRNKEDYEKMEEIQKIAQKFVSEELNK